MIMTFISGTYFASYLLPHLFFWYGIGRSRMASMSVKLSSIFTIFMPFLYIHKGTESDLMRFFHLFHFLEGSRLVFQV